MTDRDAPWYVFCMKKMMRCEKSTTVAAVAGTATATAAAVTGTMRTFESLVNQSSVTAVDTRVGVDRGRAVRT